MYLSQILKKVALHRADDRECAANPLRCTLPPLGKSITGDLLLDDLSAPGDMKKKKERKKKKYIMNHKICIDWRFHSRPVESGSFHLYKLQRQASKI